MSKKQGDRRPKWPQRFVAIGLVGAGIGTALILRSYTNHAGQLNSGLVTTGLSVLMAIVSAIVLTVLSNRRNGHN